MKQTELRHYITVGGSKGGTSDPRGSKFFHFHAVLGKNIENNRTFGSWRTSPSTENPGFATGNSFKTSTKETLQDFI